MDKNDSTSVVNTFSSGIISRLVGPPNNDTDRDARKTGVGTVWALAIGLLFAISWRPTFWASSCMWSGACALTGMLLGFLFGIPRFIARAGVPAGISVPNTQPTPPNQASGGGQQPSQTPANQAAVRDQQQSQTPANQAAGGDQQQPLAGVNTNLEEISDWLTKIIVGVSLVELQKIQVRLQEMAEFIAQSIGGAGQASFAYGLMVYFSTAGFLGSYLLTRLYLQRAFVNAARDAASGRLSGAS